MPTNKIENDLGTKISGLVEFIPRYFNTAWSVIIHPRITFDYLSTKNSSSKFLMPEAFLVINVLLSTAIGNLIGYDFQTFYINISWLQNYLGDLCFLTFRYLLGFLILLVIIKWLIAYRGTDNFIKKTFPILCYGSVLYIVYVIVFVFLGNLISDDVIIILGQELNMLATIPIKLPAFDTAAIIKILICLFVLFSVFVWWTLLIYYGLKSYKVNTLRRTKIALILGIIFVSLISFAIRFTGTRLNNSSTIKGLDIVSNTNINTEISKGSESYFKIVMDAHTVENNDMMPESIRYYFLMKKIAFEIMMPLNNNDEKLIADISSKLKERKFIELEQTIYKNQKKISSTLNLEVELKAAKSLRQSSNYIDLHEIQKKRGDILILPKAVDHPVRLSPLIIRGTHIILIPVVRFPKIISIFP